MVELVEFLFVIYAALNGFNGPEGGGGGGLVVFVELARMSGAKSNAESESEESSGTASNL